MRNTHFDSLRTTIQSTIRDDIVLELKDEIVDELTERGVNIEALIIARIRRNVIQKIATRHTASTAFHAIEDAIAKPLLNARDEKEKDRSREADWSDDEMGALEEDERSETYKQLGFMVRAPIAVAAAIPWVLGAGIWPFMARVRSNRTDPGVS